MGKEGKKQERNGKEKMCNVYGINIFMKKKLDQGCFLVIINEAIKKYIKAWMCQKFGSKMKRLK